MLKGDKFIVVNNITIKSRKLINFIITIIIYKLFYGKILYVANI